MRVFLASLFTALFAMTLGVIAHHTITTGRFGVGLASLVGVSLGCSAIFVLILRAAKKDFRWWPRISSTAILLLVAWAYLQLVASPDFPKSLKLAHAAACVILVTGAISLLFLRPKQNA